MAPRIFRLDDRTAFRKGSDHHCMMRASRFTRQLQPSDAQNTCQNEREAVLDKTAVSP